MSIWYQRRFSKTEKCFQFNCSKDIADNILFERQILSILPKIFHTLQQVIYHKNLIINYLQYYYQIKYFLKK